MTVEINLDVLVGTSNQYAMVKFDKKNLHRYYFTWSYLVDTTFLKVMDSKGSFTKSDFVISTAKDFSGIAWY